MTSREAIELDSYAMAVL